MVKITFAPIQELIVHETMEIPMDDLLRERITPAGNMPIYWCEGLAFTFSSVPMTDEVVKDYLKGVLHWAEVHYTKMERYETTVELNDPHYQAVLKVRVIDTSKSSLHSDMAKWLKKNRK
jgi:hypothetical protein